MTEQEKSREEIEEEIAIMVALFYSINSKIKDSFSDLYSLAKKYKYLGKRFRFSFDKDIQKEYEKIVSLLKNNLSTTIESAVSEALLKLDTEYTTQVWESASEAFSNDKYGTMQENIDKYCDQFGDIAEAFIVAGLLSGTSELNLWNMLTQFSGNYQNYKIFKDNDIVALIKGAVSKGKGRYISPLASIKRVAKYTLHDAFSRGKAEDMNLEGFRWYRCFRSSSYPCQICDDVCAVPHRITEIVLPVHPNCVCGMYPITEAEL